MAYFEALSPIRECIPSCGSLGLEVKMASVGRLRASGDVVEG